MLPDNSKTCHKVWRMNITENQITGTDCHVDRTAAPGQDKNSPATVTGRKGLIPWAVFPDFPDYCMSITYYIA